MKPFTVLNKVILLVLLFTLQNLSFASDKHDSHGSDSHQHGSNEHESDEHESDEHESDEHESDEHESDEHESVEHESVEHESNEHDSHEGDSHGHGSDEHDSHEQAVTISETIAKKSNIQTMVVSAGTVGEQLKIYGRIVNDPSQTNHVRARFAGTISAVHVQIGDQVKLGDVLAYVESNESLKKYPVKALMDGVVVGRHANPGELALEQVLFTLANFDKIWVELQVFPGQLTQVKSGQKVLIEFAETSIESIIEHIIPSFDEKPYALARVMIDNELLQLTPGVLVSGHVTVNQFEAKMVVKQQAIQTIENQAVVFIKEADTYSAHPVILGQTDGINTEILSGINSGDYYVSENSYLIKADIEKSGAAHVH